MKGLPIYCEIMHDCAWVKVYQGGKKMENTAKGKMTYQDEKAILMYLSELYCKAQTIAELYRREGDIGTNMIKYKQQTAVIELIDRTISSITPTARFIIIHTYIRKDGNGWYIPYYARSTFYRLKKAAVHEFNQVFQKLRD